VVKGLADAGLLEAVAEVAGPAFRPPDWERPGPDLTADQTAVAEVLRRTAAAGSFHVTLLDGVTGSGKTEVYLEAVAAALAAGRQALVLLPEIALSTQWLERFARRFGVRPAEWHSDLSQTERRVTWRAVARGDARVVVGARSALFLPFPALGLTVIDEEHDAAYKQEDGVVYHARDMAVVRARLEGRPIVLVSATPSLESLVNVADGRYAHLHLPERFSTARLPAVELVDLRQEKPPRVLARGPAWLSMPLRSAVAEALAAQEQAMLFLNRRGYAPLTLCDACGHRLKCPDCTAWLVEHRLGGRLTCHHCGYTTRLPAECPVCGAEHPFRACGPGVERIAEEAAALFPEARIAIVSSDTVASPLAAAEMVSAIEEHRVDLLVGTQILAKGHHFPLLTVVGVVDGDLGLFGGDLRAAERTFQMLQQVAGRAGRAERAGRVLVQTHEPGHPVMQALAANDRERFVAVELAHRRRDRLPPFARYAAVVISAPDAARADEAARLLARAAPRQDQVQVLGPAPAVLAVLRGRHRRRFLVKAPRTVVLQPLLRYWLGSVKVPSAVRIQVDVDPYSFL
jgi:primosomal protein N' (replication factor Y)